MFFRWFQTQILALNKKISENESTLKEKETRLKQVIQELESAKSTNETLTLQLANATAEIKNLKDTFREKEASLISQVRMQFVNCEVNAPLFEVTTILSFAASIV